MLGQCSTTELYPQPYQQKCFAAYGTFLKKICIPHYLHCLKIIYKKYVLSSES
jgi:hypothetical protein